MVTIVTCAFNNFPNTPGSGREHGGLIQAHAAHVDHVETVHILGWGNCIADCTLIDVFCPNKRELQSKQLYKLVLLTVIRSNSVSQSKFCLQHERKSKQETEGRWAVFCSNVGAANTRSPKLAFSRHTGFLDTTHTYANPTPNAGFPSFYVPGKGSCTSRPSTRGSVLSLSIKSSNSSSLMFVCLRIVSLEIPVGGRTHRRTFAVLPITRMRNVHPTLKKKKKRERKPPNTYRHQPQPVSCSGRRSGWLGCLPRE